MKITPVKMFSQFLNSFLSRDSLGTLMSYMSTKDQDQAGGGHTVDTQKVCKERMDEFSNLAKEAKFLKVPRSNRFTAYDPKTPIGGNLL